MYHYLLYGKHLETDLFFEQLIQTTDANDGLDRIYIYEGSTECEHKDEKECKYYLGRDLCYLSNSSVRFVIRDDKTIFYEKRPPRGTDRIISSYMLGWGISMLAYMQGNLAVHCSCIRKKDESYLICGISGAGKSTVTNSLLENGYSLMADDIAVVDVKGDEMYACPAFPYQKLCRDVVERRELNTDDLIYINEDKDKFLVPYAGEFTASPVKLKKILILMPCSGNDVEVHELIGMDKLTALFQNLFLYKLDRNIGIRPEIITSCLKLASKVDIATVLRPVERDTRTEVAKKILEYLR